MDQAAYAVEAAIEASHWWYVGRRGLFAKQIERLGLEPDSPILDVGTSTGANMRMLRNMHFSDVTGLDFSEEAIRFCAAKGFTDVRLGDVCAMPWPDASFALVVATDIIEHVDDHEKAVSEIFRVLKPGGHALITVPAFQSLWGLKDEYAHHKRRYRMGPLLDLIRSAGFTVERSFYFNYILFGPIWLARRVLLRVKPSKRGENQINTPLLNTVLGAVFQVDLATAGALHPPFGVSALVLAKKTDGRSNGSLQ
jgi:SAM-dependent methyltransferase